MRRHYLESNTEKPQRKHLNKQERETIERMLRQGANKSEIARALFRDKSTIKREIKRGTVLQRRANPYASRNPEVPDYIEEYRYFCDVGQRVYKQRRENCGSKNKLVSCSELVAFVEEKIQGKERWSPDAAIGYAKTHNLFPGQTFSAKTFYNWIDDGLVRVKNIDLLLKVRRRPNNPRKERKKVVGRSIEERPSIVQTREEFGHWEGDGIVGKRQQGHMITLVERKLGVGLLFNVKDRNSHRIVEILDGLQKQYGKHFSSIFKTITFDNGTEFMACTQMERDGRTAVYYAHPYSSFERGTNENWNGIVRRFIPKSSSFERLTDDELQRISHYINTLPRKRFNYRTPLDLWNEQITAILSA